MAFALVAAGIGLVSGGVKFFQGRKQKKEAKKEQDRARAQLQRRMNQYEALDTSNPYLNMENKFEDLQVNKQEAEFIQKQQEQQQANLMQGLQGAAGGSGIASLAQTLANQQSADAQRAAVSIGQQESRNQMQTAQAAQQMQAMERQGEVISRQMQKDKIGTMLGMEQQALRDANFLRADAQKMQMEGISQGLGAIGGIFSQKEKSTLGGVAGRTKKKKK